MMRSAPFWRFFLLSLLAAVPSLQAATAQPYIFTTVVGNSPLRGPLQRFAWPLGLGINASGVIYVADTDLSVVFKVTPAGEVSVLAGEPEQYVTMDGTGSAARFNSVICVAVDAAGNIFAGDNHTIRKITPAGEVTTFAGSAGVTGTTDGPKADARFGWIASLAFDSTGNLYVGDSENHTLRKITPAGTVSTIAGSPGETGSADGTGSAARFSALSALAVDAGGTIFVADGGNQTIRRITPAGVVTTLAGQAGTSGAADGTGTAARFNGPRGLTLDRAGNVYVADGSNHTIRKITAAGAVTTFAGRAGVAGGLDGTGDAARFIELSGLVCDSANNLYATDAVDGTLRKITSQAVATTLVGVGRDNALESIDGPDTAALLAPLTGIAIAANNDIYLADYFHSVIRKVPAGGHIMTLAGGMDERGFADGPGTTARFSAPFGVAVDAAGTVYVADTVNNMIRKISPAGVVSSLAGSPTERGFADGPGATALFNNPMALAVDTAGTVFVSDGSYVIRKITAQGVVSTLAGKPDNWGFDDGTGETARFYRPGSMVLDATGNIYVLDARVAGTVVRKVTPAGVVTTLANSEGATGITLDSAGNVIIAGTTLRQVSAAGVVTAVAAKAITTGAAGTSVIDVEFEKPGAISADAKGNLYVASGRAIHKGQPASAPVISAQPQAASVAPGDSVQFSVTATGLPEPTYQWYVNGTAFQGATSRQLSFSNARTSDAGDYTVVVSNLAGDTASAKAALTVKAVVTPTTPSGGSGSAGGGGGGAPSMWFVLALGALGGLRLLPGRKAGVA